MVFEENVDERDDIIVKQRGEIYDMENSSKFLKKKRMQLLVGVDCIVGVMNIVMVCLCLD